MLGTNFMKLLLAGAVVLSCLPLLGEGPGTAPGPARPAANVILENPFPQDAALGATLVSLDLKDATAERAYAALAKAGKMPQTDKRPAFAEPHPVTVTLALDHRPYLDALLQIRTELAHNTAPAKRSGFPVETAPGVWCVTGAFCFTLGSIDHTVYPGPNGDTVGGDITGLMGISAEPRIRILLAPRTVELTEAVDDKDNALLPDPKVPIFGGFPGTPRLVLKYPKEPGRRIVRLKGTAALTVQGAGEDVTIDALDEVTVTTCGGMKISVGPMSRSGDYFELPTVFDRGEMPADKFESIQAALAAVKPALFDLKGEGYHPPTGEAKREKDRVSFQFRYWNPPMSQHAPAVRVTMNVPTEVKDLCVPFEFRDLPLP